MSEEEFIKRWDSERPMYEAWGYHVVETIMTRLAPAITPVSTDIFIKIPPKPRMKDHGSLLDKAFHRKKPYKDPYAEITDKVGVRFVVLLQSEIEKVATVITGVGDWTASKDKDFELEQEQNPLQFDYQSVHYVVKANRDIDVKVDGKTVRVQQGTPCEIQVRTLLQHAHSEVSHTIYKPKVDVTPRAKRAIAKSMALIEATGEFFEQVTAEIASATRDSRSLAESLASLYRSATKREPVTAKAGVLIIETLLPMLGKDPAARVEQMLKAKGFIGDAVAGRAATRYLYRQPAILLVYLLVLEAPGRLKAAWPLSADDIRPIFTDLGLNFDKY